MILDPILDLFRGRAITIPPMDGAFRANTALDDSPVLAPLADADNLCVVGGQVYASSGANLFVLRPGTAPELVQSHAAPITALAADATGLIALALDDGSLIIGAQPVTLPKGISCITALAFGPDGSLWLANGSDRHPATGWVADLMEKNSAGSVWRRGADGGFVLQAGGLGWPYGLLPDATGCVVSEAWRHRLLRLEGGKTLPVLAHLPGYPARLSPCTDGGAWLAIFAPRNRLIEFVLQETHYRQDMMASVPRAFWIAPAVATGRSFLEPLQCGGIRSMGVHKAWSSSLSYGLALRLDANLAPASSLHSRANGTRHGTCSVVEFEGRALVASRGGNCVLAPEGME